MVMRSLEWPMTVAIVCLCLARPSPLECKETVPVVNSLVIPTLPNKFHTKLLVSITTFDTEGDQTQNDSYLIDEIYSDLSSRVTVKKIAMISGDPFSGNDRELQSESTTTYISRTNHDHSVFKISDKGGCESRAIEGYMIEEIPFTGLDERDNHTIIGPTKVINFFQQRSDQLGPEVAESAAIVTHRGIVCREYLFTLRLDGAKTPDHPDNIMLIVSYFVPVSPLKGSGDIPDAPVAIGITAVTKGKQLLSVYFDYLVMEASSIHSTSEAFLLPPGIGCSDLSSLALSKNFICGINESFIAKVTRRSFDYRLSDARQLYKSTSTVAFSKQKQVASIRHDDSKTKVIVDINSRLAHYIDLNEDPTANNNSNAGNSSISGNLGNRCSAIQLDGYRSIKSISLDNFMGLGKAALLGRASIDGHHECYVYETRLTEAWPLFFSPIKEQKLFESSSSLSYMPNTDFYIVIYIAHRADYQPANNSGQSNKEITSLMTTFPRRIEIYKRQKLWDSTGKTESTLMERVDFSGFVWKQQYSVETSEEMSLLKVDDCCNLQTIQRPTQVEIIAKFSSDINTQLLINAAQRNIIDSFESLLLSKLSVPSPQITEIGVQSKSGTQIYFRATIADYPSSQTRLIYIGNGPIVDGTSVELEHLTLDRERYLTRDNCLLRASLNQNVQFVSYCYTTSGGQSSGRSEQATLQILCLALNTARISEKVGGPCEYYSVERTYRDFIDHGNSKQQLVQRLLQSGAKTLQNEQIVVELDQFKQSGFVRNRAFGLVASSIFFAPIEEHLILNSVSFKIISVDDQSGGHYYLVKTAKTLRECHLLCNSRLSCNSYSYCASMPGGPSECILSDLTILTGSNAEIKLQQALTKYLSPVVRRTVASVEFDGSIYTFETNANCQLRQKDYTKLFSRSSGQTMLVEVKDGQDSQQSRTSLNSCAASCAKNATNCLRMAYCFKYQSCYLEHEFPNTTRDYSFKSKQLTDDSSLVDDHCLIYSRKFSSLYSITRRKAIVDSNDDNSKSIKQFNKYLVKLADVRPEVCAKSCSSELGPKCLAFDHCLFRSKSKPDYCQFAIMVASSNDTTIEQYNFPLESNLHCDHYAKEQHTSLEWLDQSNEEDNGQISAPKISYLITTLSCATFVTIAYIVTYRAFVVERYERFRQNSELFELSARG